MIGKKYLSTLKRYPLSTRMVAYIFGFALFAAVMASLIHLRLAYVNEIERIEEKLENLEKEQIDLLVNNLWSFDTHAIDIQFNSILSDPDMVRIQIMIDGAVAYEAGIQNPQKNALQKRYVLNHQGKHLGDAIVFATVQNVKNRLFAMGLGSLAAHVVAVLFTCLFIVFLVIILLIRPISAIYDFTNTIKLENLDTDFSLNRKNKSADELDAITDALNAMRKRLKKDIQEKQKMKNDLKSEQAFSDTVINSLPGIFFVLNEESTVIRHNRQFFEQTSIPESIGRPDIFTLVDKRDHKKLKLAFEQVFTQEKPVALEVLIINPKSDSIPYFLNCSLLLLKQTSFLIGIGSDLRDRKRIEENLRQAQKMESIGTLAGGIAHDFNNILSVIFGYAEIAATRVADPEANRYFDNILKAAKRARELVRQILTFSRKNEQEDTVLRVSLVVSEALKLLRSTIPTTIDIHSQITSNKTILSDPTQVHQIIMNLCTNAYHAMLDNGGVMTVRLTDVSISEKTFLHHPGVKRGNYVLLEVGDTGCGIDPDVKEKIFDPYFTTKEKGSGTGLGLAVVHGIVERNNGHLLIESKPGEGSLFKIYFPVHDQDPETDLTALVYETGDLTGHEHIMVVDDECGLREATRLLLEDYGYTVSDFGDGKSALAAFSTAPDQYDLVLTDMTMPKMTGLTLGSEILSIQPGTRIILCTGFNEIVTREIVQDAGFARFLQKPVEADRLLTAVRNVLDKK